MCIVDANAAVAVKDWNAIAFYYMLCEVTTSHLRLFYALTDLLHTFLLLKWQSTSTNVQLSQ